MTTAHQLHLQAFDHARQGQFAAAIQLWQQALQQDPTHILSWQNMAIAQYKTYDYVGAVHTNRQVLTLTTEPETQAHVLLNLGAALVKTRDYDEAIATYRSALKLKPNWYAARRNLGNVLTLTEELLEAETLLRDVLAEEPDDGENYHALGNVMRDQGRYEDALVFFRQAIALKPDHVQAHNNLGNVLQERGELEDAERCYRQALALDPARDPALPCRSETGQVFGEPGRSRACSKVFSAGLLIEGRHVDQH